MALFGEVGSDAAGKPFILVEDKEEFPMVNDDSGDDNWGFLVITNLVAFGKWRVFSINLTGSFEFFHTQVFYTGSNPGLRQTDRPNRFDTLEWNPK